MFYLSPLVIVTFILYLTVPFVLHISIHATSSWTAAWLAIISVTTTTELFTTFSLKTLVDHLSTHPLYSEQQLKVTAFSDLPTDLYQPFQGLCIMAFGGILNKQQLVFSAADLPTEDASLSLMQEVPQLYTEGRSRASSYHFIHLTLQEYLAAVHISQLPACKWADKTSSKTSRWCPLQNDYEICS